MRLGLHVSNFTWPGGPARIGPDLRAAARGAEAAGFDRMSVMDHVFQISLQGPPEEPMLEAYTALGFLAGCTERIRLLTLVTGAVYRSPGLLAKMVTTLDVVSQGRAMLGIGAAWNEEEARGLGLSFPPLAERFERLEETLRICLQMWSGEDGPFEGAQDVLQHRKPEEFVQFLLLHGLHARAQSGSQHHGPPRHRLSAPNEPFMMENASPSWLRVSSDV